MRAAALVVALLMAGCGGSSGGAGDGESGYDLAGIDVQYIINDAGEIIYLVDVRPDDVPDETTPGDTPAVDPGPDSAIEAVPCTAASACESGFCVDVTATSKACADDCTSSGQCPAGWACRAVTVDGDAHLLCMPPAPRLCRPCSEHADCQPAGLVTQDLCVPYGSLKGSFCGMDCEDDGKCPAGYDCRAIDLREGGGGRQCVPSEGECACSAESIAAGLSTPCSQEGAAGVCTGSRTCTSTGLTVCDAPLPAAEKCNNKDDDCNGQTDEGVSSGSACQLTVVGVGSCPGTSACVKGAEVCQGTPPIAESCDGLDSDCDGDTDPEGSTGCTTYHRDQDGDGAGLETDTKCLCAAETPYSADNGLDCDDGDATVGPNGAEACGGGDEDCDGLTDDAGATGCLPFYADVDLDGWGDAADSACLCAADAAHPAAKAGDCDDHDATSGAATDEACNGRDDDCDGSIDEADATGCVPYWSDGDGDGHGAAGETRCLCAPAAPWTAPAGDDCDDADAQAAPGTAEVCDGKDNDCDGKADTIDALGCDPFYLDDDGDGFGTQDSRCLCAAEGKHTAGQSGDCDDASAAVHPDATEACDGKDDNCDGRTDEAGATGCTARFKDVDRDGYGAGASTCLCAAAGDWIADVGGDCNDGNAGVHPGAAEQCNAGVDDDCDGWADLEGSPGCTLFYLDSDGDGFGTPAGPRCLCAASGKYTAKVAGDCADTNATTTATKPESCNSKDDDCDGETDEDENAAGCSTWFADRDGDFHGSPSDSKCFCGAQGVYRLTAADDCDDSNAAIPGTEACNGLDDDCDGSTDEGSANGCVPHYLDMDGDGWGATVMMKCLCGPDAGYSTTQGGDCKDTDASIHPQATELCNNIDEDCDGVTDDDMGTTTCGTGVCLKTIQNCKAGKLQVCDPLSGALAEACDLLDNDCDGITDEDFGTTTCGKGECIHTVNNCRNGAIQGCNPLEGAGVEVCDGKDNDCDGVTDEDQGTVSCGIGPCLHAVQACKDGVPQACDPLQGAAAEICDSIDNDCDGSTDDDDACTTLYRIGIDPENGGGTGACGCSNLCEDAINLAIAQKTQALLDADTGIKDKGGRWEVYLTRTTNTAPTPSLATRLGYLNSKSIQRLVIVSGNAYQTCTTMNYTIGTEVHRETAADAKGVDLATKMASQVSTHFDTTNRGVKTDDTLYLLNNLSAPAVWLGVGFLTNSAEATKLNTDSWQQKAAVGILHALQQNVGWVEFTPP